jgi:hypothetical protein
MDSACDTNGEEIYAYGLYVEKPEGKRPLGCPGRKRLDSMIMGLGGREHGVYVLR